MHKYQISKKYKIFPNSNGNTIREAKEKRVQKWVILHVDKKCLNFITFSILFKVSFSVTSQKCSFLFDACDCTSFFFVLHVEFFR